MKSSSKISDYQAAASSRLSLMEAYVAPSFDLRVLIFIVLMAPWASGQDSPVKPDKTGEGGSPDQVADELPTELQTFATEREYNRVFSELEKAIQQGNWVPVAETILKLQGEDANLLARYRESVASVSVAATRILGKLPREGLDVYRRLAEPVAAEKLRLALLDSDYDALRQVARCYRQTTASDRALQLLIKRFLDLGEWEEALLLSQRPGTPSVSRETLQFLNDEQSRQITSGGAPQSTPEFLESEFPSQIPRWESKIELLPEVRTSLDNTYRELRESGLGPYPSMSFTYSQSSVVACGPSQRTALDPETGTQLWTREIPGYMSNWMRNPGDLTDAIRRRMFSISVARRVFDETITSRTSSNGQHLYLVEMIELEDPILKEVNQENIPFSTSRIICLNAATGEALWTFNGIPPGEVFFSGPPALFGDRLYALGEHLPSGSLKLFTLEASSGKLLHSLELARSISAPVGNRDRDSQAARIELHGGQLICATGSGSLLSIDPLFGEITWVVRMPRGQQDKFHLESSELQMRSAGFEAWGGWQEVQLHHIGDNMVYVTPESDRLYVLNRRTGQLIQQIPRGRAVHLIGTASPPSLILIEKRLMRAIEPESGKELWETPIPQPAGRGIVLKSSYLFPILESDTARVDLVTGALKLSPFAELHRAEPNGVLPKQIRPRQLQAVSGALYELSLDGVRQFQSSREAELSGAKETRVAQLLNQVEQGKNDGLFSKLQQELNTATPPQQTLIQEMLQLLILSESQSTTPSPDLNSQNLDLQNLFPTPAARGHLRMIQAQAAVARHDWKNFASLWIRIPSDELEILLPASQEDFRIRMDRWFQATAQNIIDGNEEDRAELMRQLASQLSSPTSTAPGEQLRLWRCLGLSLPGRRWITEMSSVPDDALSLVQMKLQWLTLTMDSEPDISAAATFRLMESAFAAKRFQDAQRWLDHLKSLPAETALPGNRSTAKIVGEWEQKISDARRQAGLSTGWSERTPAIRVGNSLTREVYLMPIRTEAARGSLFDRINVEVDYPAHQAIRWNGATFPRPWYQKLPNTARNLRLQPGLDHLWGFEDFAVLQCGSEVFGLTPLTLTGGRTSKQLWPPKNESIDTLGKRENLMLSLSWVSRTTRPGFESIPVERLDEFLHPLASVGPVRAGYFCMLQQGMLVAVDTATGKELWRRYDLPEHPFVFGDDQTIAVIAPEPETITFYSTLDGRRTHRKQCSIRPSDIIAVEGLNFLTVQGDMREEDFSISSEDTSAEGEEKSSPPPENPRSRTDKVALEWRNAATTAAIWRREWTPGSLPFEIDQSWVGMLSPDGLLEIIEIQTGKTFREHRIAPPKNIERIVCSVAENDLLVVISDHIDPDSPIWELTSQSGYRQPLINGQGYCFSRSTGDLLWKNDSLEGLFRLEQPVDLPVFVLVSMEPRLVDLIPPADELEVPNEEESELEDVDFEITPPPVYVVRCYHRRDGTLLKELKGTSPQYAIIGDLERQRLTLNTMRSRLEIDFSPPVEHPDSNR